MRNLFWDWRLWVGVTLLAILVNALVWEAYLSGDFL
jgi:hypothetical protein